MNIIGMHIAIILKNDQMSLSTENNQMHMPLGTRRTMWFYFWVCITTIERSIKIIKSIQKVILKE